MVDETLLYRSCRICSVNTLGSDFIELLQKEEDEFNKSLTTSGKLYEELMGLKVLCSEPAYYPKSVCSNCDLQMKLFKGLKERALNTLKKLESQRNESSRNDFDTIVVTEQILQEESLATLGTKTEENGEHQEFDSNICYKEKSLQPEEDSDYDKEDKEYEANMLIVYDTDYDDDLETNEKLGFLSVDANGHHGENTFLDKPTNEELKESSNYIEVQYFQNENDNAELGNVEEVAQNSTADLQHTSLSNKIDTKFKCKECSVELATHRLLRVHRQQNHSLVHHCAVCSKALRSAEALEVHMKQHLGLPAYTCSQCNKTFKQKVHYQYHMKRHNNERNFNCTECGKGYVSKSDLATHMRQHSGIRRYKCTVEDCGKQFFTEQHLKMHMFHHNKGKSFECDICHRKFVSPTVLHTHRQSIHVERRFECSICGKKFRRKHHLEVHEVTHEKDHTAIDDNLVEENVDSCFLGNDKTMNMNEQPETSNEFYFDDFVTFDRLGHDNYSDNEFFRAAIESCPESETENGLDCYNIYGS